MPLSPSRRPLLPSHYFVWSDPPDAAGDEVLHIVSERRTLKLKGRAFREFTRVVAPLLDGTRTLAEIETLSEDVFRREDLGDFLELLAAQGVIVDGDGAVLPPEARARMTPQLNFFHDLAPGGDLQERLTRATVAVLGVGGAGATAAWALAQAGVGTVRCVDAVPVSATDAYWSPVYDATDVGLPRGDVLARTLGVAAPQVNAVSHAQPLESEDDIRQVIEGADYVLCCLDPSQSNLIFKLNRVCLQTGTRWCACSLGGTEIVAGPAVVPGESACYLCYRMRAVACAGSPEEAFAHEKFLDRRKRDDLGRRGNVVFGAGIAGHLVALEAFNAITGLAEPALVGRIQVVRLTDLVAERHMVLRKPWCPACFTPPAGDA